MFTGIVQAVGEVRALERRGDGARARIATPAGFLEGVAVGDSVAVSGVCLTAVAVAPGAFEADLSGETLARSTLGALAPGARVNLEKALTPSTPLGGHLVTGHVDGVATVTAREAAGGAVRMAFAIPRALARYVARKGSVCVDGVSLTVNAVTEEGFEVALVPHTLAVTTLGALRPGARVNLEVDIVARYLERLLEGRGGEGLSWERLAALGYGRGEG